MRFDELGSLDSGLLTTHEWKEVARASELTPRELRVVQCVFNAGTRLEIAKTLGISEHTVRQHMEQIHRKLDVHNRVGVVLRAVQLSKCFSKRARTSDVPTSDEG